MPGSGRAPKALGARRNHHPPLRGEWVELPPLDRPALPELPERPGEGDWSQRAVETWEAWRSDPVTSQFTASDIAFLVDTLLLVDLCARKPRASLASEIRPATSPAEYPRAHRGSSMDGLEDRVEQCEEDHK